MRNWPDSGKPQSATGKLAYAKYQVQNPPAAGVVREYDIKKILASFELKKNNFMKDKTKKMKTMKKTPVMLQINLNK